MPIVMLTARGTETGKIWAAVAAGGDRGDAPGGRRGGGNTIRSGGVLVKMAWVALAIAGLLIAVGVSYAASRLASPDVGLSSEPITAGSKLAPARTTEDRPPAKAKPTKKKKRTRTNPTPTATTPAAPPPATPAAPPATDDNSGHGGGSDDSGGHGGGNDD